MCAPTHFEFYAHASMAHPDAGCTMHALIHTFETGLPSSFVTISFAGPLCQMWSLGICECVGLLLCHAHGPLVQVSFSFPYTVILGVAFMVEAVLGTPKT